MLVYADRVHQTSTAPGLSNFTLDGTVVGWQTFLLGVGHTNTCYYCATDGNNWEVGLGTFTSGGTDVLARTTQYSSSAGGAKVNFPADVNVFTVLPASILSGALQSALNAANSLKFNNQDPSYYLSRGNHTGSQTLSSISDAGALAALNTLTPGLISPQGAGSGLDADKLDGQHGTYYDKSAMLHAWRTGGNIITAGSTRYGNPMGTIVGQAIESSTIRQRLHGRTASKYIENFFISPYTNTTDGSVVVTLMKDGVATAVAVTIPAGGTSTYSDTTNSFQLSKLEGLSLRWNATAATTGNFGNITWGFDIR